MNTALRLAAALVVAPLCAAIAAGAPIPVPKANYEPPTATFQMVAGQKLLLDVAMYCQNVFNKETNDELAAMTKKLVEDKTLSGLDLTRPFGAYAYLRPKVQERAFVLVVPVTGEKEAVEMLGRIGIEVVKEDKARNMYTLRELKFNKWDMLYFLDGVSPVIRFYDKHAYVAFHTGESDVLDKTDKLVPITALVNEKETAHIAGVMHFDRFPKELQKPLFDVLVEGQQGVAMLQQRAPADMPKGFPACAAQVLTWCQRNLAASFEESETLGIRFSLDPKMGDHDLEAVLTPKAKTAQATDILAVKKANGRFAQLLTKEAATGVSMTLPGPIPADIRTTAGVFLSDWLKLAFVRDLAPLDPIKDVLADVVNKQVAAGQVDLAGAVYGTDKDGKYTALVAIGITDAAATEKALKAALKDAPKEIADLIKWDAVKIGDFKAHTVTMPDGFDKVFGEKNLLHFVFTKDAAYVAIGSEAVSRIEKAMALKAADCVGFNMVIHKEKFGPMTETMGMRGMKLPLAAKDELLPIYRMDIYGGDGLRVKMHLGMLMFMVAGREGKGAVAPPVAVPAAP